MVTQMLWAARDFFATAARVCLMSFACACAAQDPGVSGAATTKATASAAATRGAGADISQGLAKSLTRPYWGYGEEQWRTFLKGIKLFSVAQRDRRFSALGRQLERTPQRSDLRILSLEHVGQLGIFGSYDHQILYLDRREKAAPPLEALAELKGRRLSAEQWQKLEVSLQELLRIGGTNNGVNKPIWDSIGQGTVLSFYDGSQWRIETWFCFNDLQTVYDDRIPASAEGLRPEMRAFFTLLLAMRRELDPPVDFASEHFEGLVQKYGQNSINAVSP